MNVADSTFNIDVRLYPPEPTQSFQQLRVELIAEDLQKTCASLDRTTPASAFRLMYSGSATTAAIKRLFLLPRLQHLIAL